MTQQPQQDQDRRYARCHGRLAIFLLVCLLSISTAAADITAPDDIDSNSEIGVGVSRSPLTASQLDNIRGRYAPPTTLKTDNPIAVILWDESTPGQMGPGNSQQRSNGQANQQRTTLQSHTAR